MDVKLHNQKGKQIGTLSLSDDVFACEYNQSIIHQVVVAQANNKRQGSKCTLTRSEVRGGGAKPYRQKGTGRARQGSTRSPQWIKGGVVFAPKPRDFSQKVNKKIKRAAIKSALSQKLRQDEIFVVDKIVLSDAKTKLMVDTLSGLKLSDSKVLFVVDNGNEGVVRACQNLPKVKTIAPEFLDVTSVVDCQVCLMTEKAIKQLEEAYNDNQN